MIEKLQTWQRPLPNNPVVVENMGMDNKSLFEKINEIVDAVNGILDYAPLEMAMKAEPKTRSKNVQDHKIRSTNERLREALSLAENALIRLANDAYDMDEHIYIDAILNQIERITKGGNNE